MSIAFGLTFLQLEVLDLSFSNLISLPRIDLVNRAPQLRYLLLEGNLCMKCLMTYSLCLLEL